MAIMGCVESPEARYDKQYVAQVTNSTEVRDNDLARIQQAAAIWPSVWDANMAAFRAGKIITSPKLIRLVSPHYPRAMQRLKQERTVWVALLQDKQGRVVSVHPLRDENAPLMEEFIAAAAEAVSQWEFTPCLIDGNPVEHVNLVPVKFLLKPE